MRGVTAAMLVGSALMLSTAADAQKRKPPYWASVSAGEASMRSGPGKNYPITWVYRRANLPIRVVDVYREWRKVEDPEGTQGWIWVNLLSDKRTGFVASGVVEMRTSPDPNARISWRAARGVVGVVSRCSGGWCFFDVNGQRGYVEQARLWGVEPGEDL